MRRLSFAVSATALATLLASGASAQDIVVDDFSTPATASSHPAGAGVSGTWYDITSDAFASDPVVISGELQISDGGFTNGVYIIYDDPANSAPGYYQLAVDIAVDESGGATDAIDQYQVGAAVGANAIHRDVNPSDLPLGDVFGAATFLTDNDDTAAGFETVSTFPFFIGATDDLRVALSTDVTTGDYSAGAGGWGGSFVLADNITLTPATLDNNNVIVDADGTANGTTVFNTLTDALNSFTTGGANVAANSDSTPNTISLVGFHVYDEVYPTLDDSFGTDELVISGTPGNRSLLLIQDSGDTDGLNVEGSLTVTFNDVIMAASDTTTVVADDLIEIEDGVTFNFNNSVMTSLPPSATTAYNTYTAESDITASLIDTSLVDFDNTLVFAGDNGFRLQSSATFRSTTNITNSVIKHQNADPIVSFTTAGNADLNISDSYIIGSGQFGIQLNNGTNTITNTLISNTASDSVQIFDNGNLVESTTITGSTLQNSDGGGIDWDEGDLIVTNTTISNNAAFGLFLLGSESPIPTVTLDNLTIQNNGTWGLQSFADADSLTGITNSTITGNGAAGSTQSYGIDGGGIEVLSDDITNTFAITNCTITVAAPANVGVRVGRPGDSAATAVDIDNSIIVGGFGGAALEVFEAASSSVTVDDSALVSDLGGAALVEDVGGNVTVTNVTNFDPAFVDAAGGDFDVQADTYVAAGPAGGNLTGDGAYVGGASAASIDLGSVTASIDFGQVFNGLSATDSSISVTNTGGASATVNVALSGTDAADFAADSLVVAGGATVSIPVTFTPSAVAVASASAELTGLSTINGPANVTLAGEGIAAPSDGIVTFSELAPAGSQSISPSATDELNGIVGVVRAGSFFGGSTLNEVELTDGNLAPEGNLSGLGIDGVVDATPAVSLFWDLTGGSGNDTADITELRVFSQNNDARAFHTYEVFVTTDNPVSGTSAWTEVAGQTTNGLITNAPFGSTNSVDAVGVSVVEDLSDGFLGQNVTGLRVDFYRVDNTANRFDDPFASANPSDTDGFEPPIAASWIREVDAFFTVNVGTSVDEWMLLDD